MKITRHIKSIMEELNKQNKDTDTGDIGTPRSGAEGMIEQIPSASIPEDCEQDQSTFWADQATEEIGKKEHKIHMELKEQEMYAFMSASEGDNSDTSEWLSFPTPKHIAGQKQDRESSPEEALTKNQKKKPSEKAIDDIKDPDSIEDYIHDPDIEPPPPSKSARRLLSAIELAKDMRELSTTDMVALIINRAKASEKIAAKSKNFKGNFKRYMREGAGMQKAAVTELAKRVNATGGTARLEEENIKLRTLRAGKTTCQLGTSAY